MSKYVKNLLTDHIKGELEGVDDAILVNVVGLNANANNRLRTELSDKGMRVLVVKNSLARRATEGTSLAPLFEDLTGSSAVCWGGEDIVSLAKEVVRLAKEPEFEAFEAKRGVMEGEPLSSDQVTDVSKWPSREEQIAILVGQIQGVGAGLASQLLGPGSALASQIAQKAEGESDEAPTEA
jgi:large subunit ribosomal protein L10